MTILLTGTAGFVGWKTSQLLLEQGHHVIGLDNLNDYYDVCLKHWRLEQLKGFSEFSFVKGDVQDLPQLESIFAQHSFNAVINLAARAGVRASIEDPFIYANTNAIGTLNLLECMRKHGVNKFVLASTSSLYAGQEMPFTETLPVNEPISPYAATKKAAEVMAYTYHHLHKIDVSIVRYFTVYGPAGRPDMSPLKFLRQIANGDPFRLFGDGCQSRDFTYIDDIANGTTKALKPVGYQIINLGGGNNPISINHMISTFEKHLGKKAVIQYEDFNSSDMLHTWANIEKANKLLNWYPETDFDKGMKETVSWYLDNKDMVDQLDIDI